LFQVLVIGSAVAAALFRPGRLTVEDAYARDAYPIIQANVTSLSNQLPIALFDIALIVVVLIVIATWVINLRRAKKKKLRGIGQAVLSTTTIAAVIYLWFLSTWGLNYARQPLEARLPFDASRVTPSAVRALAEHAVREANRTYAAGHAAGFPAVNAMPQDDRKH
jgi:hypothetical protein